MESSGDGERASRRGARRLGLSSEHAPELIGEIVREASCPVIALLAARDPAYVREAAKCGVFAYIVDTTPEELQSAIDITLQRFTEYHSLQGAFGRRAAIEQAKGILMARHAIDSDRAFEMLREHSQHNGHKVADVAAAIIGSRPARLDAPPPRLSAGPRAGRATRSGSIPPRRSPRLPQPTRSLSLGSDWAVRPPRPAQLTPTKSHLPGFPPVRPSLPGCLPQPEPLTSNCW